MNTTFTHKDGHGSLFINDKKTADAQPDRRGTAVVGGVEYNVSGWLKQGARGQFLSLAFTPKDDPKPAPTDDGDW